MGERDEVGEGASAECEGEGGGGEGSSEVEGGGGTSDSAVGTVGEEDSLGEERASWKVRMCCFLCVHSRLT